jgi:hypothetical protein
MAKKRKTKKGGDTDWGGPRLSELLHFSFGHTPSRKKIKARKRVKRRKKK